MTTLYRIIAIVEACVLFYMASIYPDSGTAFSVAGVFTLLFMFTPSLVRVLNRITLVINAMYAFFIANDVYSLLNSFEHDSQLHDSNTSNNLQNIATLYIISGIFYLLSALMPGIMNRIGSLIGAGFAFYFASAVSSFPYGSAYSVLYIIVGIFYLLSAFAPSKKEEKK
jgi:hypothetical protein